jgi:peroxiredoxin
VKRNYEKYREAGFMVVGLSFDRNGEAWKRAIRENGLDWIHLSDLKYWQTVAAETYGIRSIPSSILVDPKGKIIDVDLRGERLGKKLEEIYGF